MDHQQFLDGLTSIERRLMYIVTSLSENEIKYIAAKEVLRILATEDWKIDEYEFESSCEELNGYVGTIDSYSSDTVGYLYRILLRMGQPWHCRYPYFDLHGAIGDLHDDQPSGPEYVQLRLSRFSSLMITERKRPFLPLSLLNGTTTPNGNKIPSHHLGEVWMAMEEVRQNPDVTLEGIIEIIPGPDFASGGVVFGNESIHKFYREGQGILTLRGNIETLIEGPSTRIAITSLPQGVLVQTVMDQIRKLLGKQSESFRFKNASSHNNISIILDTSNHWSPSALKELLYNETDLSQEIPFSLSSSSQKPPYFNENPFLIALLKFGIEHCAPAWKKKSGDATEYIPFLKDILKHGGYKSPLSDLVDERRTRILNS